MILVILGAIGLFLLLFIYCACVISSRCDRKEANMNKLEMYKALSNEDKDNLLMYSIYNGIYDVARNHNSNISDKEVETLADLSYDIYLDDSTYDFSWDRITYFITDCYLSGNAKLDTIESCDYRSILDAIDSYDSEFDFKNKDIER